MTAPTGHPIVLFVDDLADIREMYRLVLEDEGYDVADAANGHEAIRQAETLLPSVIVMDLLMPVLDGFEASRRLRRDPATAPIPIIALTGQGAPASAEDEALFDAWLTKPCLPDELVAVIRRVMGGPSSGEDSLLTPPPVRPRSPSSGTSTSSPPPPGTSRGRVGRPREPFL